MIRKLGTSVIIQFLGTLSSFALVWLITRYYGIEKQGEFALLKSWVDFIVVIGCFGLPQSFIYAINKFNISAYKLKQFSKIYSLAFVFVAYFITYFWFNLNVDSLNVYSGKNIFIAIAIAGLIGHGLLRGIYLTQNDGNKFAVITILPAVSLFVLAVLATYSEILISLPLLYFISGVFCFIVMLVIVNPYNEGNKINWKPIFRNGTSVFMQGLAMVLLPMSTYWLMSYFAASNKMIGGFNLAVYFYQLFALPLNMISPIFFNRWSNFNNQTELKKEFMFFLLFGVPVLFVSLIFAYLLKFIAPFVFGDDIYFAIPSMQIMLGASSIIYFNNLLSCLHGARGYFYTNMQMYILKALFSVALVYISVMFFKNNIEVVAWSWLLGDALLLIFLSVSYVKKF